MPQIHGVEDTQPSIKCLVAASADVAGGEVRARDPGGAGREPADHRRVGAGGGRGGAGAGRHRHPRGRGLHIQRPLRQMGRPVQVPFLYFYIDTFGEPLLQQSKGKNCPGPASFIIIFWFLSDCVRQTHKVDTVLVYG